ncbi:hypothetical protein [Kitasatospora sp. NPDC057500]|uniref:hypothetical protein n=1 Tax=Kitasatospora sp. NPDC057500 TaxID=3346151 RepID=UPI00368DC7FA
MTRTTAGTRDRALFAGLGETPFFCPPPHPEPAPGAAAVDARAVEWMQASGLCRPARR